MKFSEIQETQWEELRPYLDTCLLPVTGLRGTEAPWQAASELERLRDALDLLEIPFKGRTVTYPAIHFVPSSPGETFLGETCARLKEAGFRYVVIVTAKSEEELVLNPEELRGKADLWLRFTPEELRQSASDAKRRAAEEVTALWNGRQTL